MFSSSVFLDGELWFGRSSFSEAQQVIYSSMDTHWALSRMLVFDEAPPSASDHPFEERYTHLLQNVPFDSPFLLSLLIIQLFAYSAPRVSGVGKRQISKLILEIINDGGEGIMMRRPASLYEHGRSTSLIKYKSSREDREALVVDIKGDHIELQLPNGIVFHVAMNELPNNNNIEIKGTVVTFSYESFSQNGVPANPRMSRVREDISWKQILLDFSSHGSMPRRVIDETRDKERKKAELRELMIGVAKEMNINPFSPEHWYSISSKSVAKLKEGKRVLNFYNGSMINALVDLFPEIQFDSSRFSFLPNNYWKNIDNRKAIFFNIAKEKGFDPFVPENWYTIPLEEIRKFKGIESLLAYEGSIHKALIHLFPDIGFDASKFPSYMSWQNESSRKDIFINFAKEKGFDPLIPSNWYSIPRDQLLSLHGASSILPYYNGSFSKALLHLFPDIGLDIDAFDSRPRKYWRERENQRKVFDEYAKQHNFNPLIAENWYNVTYESLTLFKGISSILQHHSGSFVSALFYIYPSVQFEKHKFNTLPKKYWQSEDNRKSFFINLAEEKGFDPLIPENWFSVTSTSIFNSSIKGATSILHYYDGNLAKALAHLFPHIGLKESKFYSGHHFNSP